MRAPIDVVLYTKPGCHLCEDAEELLDALAEQHPLAVHAVDITRDVELYSRYWSKIPVVKVGDAVLHAPLDAATLQRVVLGVGQEQS
jgi:glutaredoxin